jgi:ABC-type phosphate/phosphonate transport system substrate-binding protein
MNKRLLFLLSLIAAMLIAACGGGGQTSSSGGTPADAAKAYLNASLLGQGDPASLLCSTLPADTKQQMQSAFDTMKQTYAASGAKLDISGLTFTSQNESGDSAEVVVSGKIKVEIGGNSQELDYPQSTIKMKNENGWKVCG